ncbi:MAG: PAS domain S-box protein, partial [Syntrophobacteraceae bacterium]
MSAESEGTKWQYPKLTGLLLVFASILAVVAFYALDITFLYEPKHLLGVTNTIFTAIIPLVVAFFAARTFLRTGSFSVLLMGCGMLGFGLCAGSAGWLRELQGGANFNVTIYNTGALLGSVCHFAGAAVNSSRKSYQLESGRQKLIIVPTYSAIFLFAVLLSFATVQQVVPPFFVQGSGPTAIRQIVLGLAIFLYATSSILFMNNYLRLKSDFLYWYSLCLAMLALGLFAFYIQKVVGSPIGWVGRTSNYVGTIFSLIAILAAVRSGKSRGLPLEEVISGFFVDSEANYRSLVETATDAIISFDQQNRIILWNSSAEKIFGYTKA